MLKGVPSSGTRVEELWQDEAIWTLKCKFVRLNCRQNCDREFSRWNCSEATADLASLIILSGAVHTGVEVHGMDSEMSGLVEQPWLQLMCCTIYLPRGCNFR